MNTQPNAARRTRLEAHSDTHPVLQQFTEICEKQWSQTRKLLITARASKHTLGCNHLFKYRVGEIASVTALILQGRFFQKITFDDVIKLLDCSERSTSCFKLRKREKGHLQNHHSIISELDRNCLTNS